MGRVQRYKGDGTPIDSVLFEEAADDEEERFPMVSDVLIP